MWDHNIQLQVFYIVSHYPRASFPRIPLASLRKWLGSTRLSQYHTAPFRIPRNTSAQKCKGVNVRYHIPWSTRREPGLSLASSAVLHSPLTSRDFFLSHWVPEEVGCRGSSTLGSSAPVGAAALACFEFADRVRARGLHHPVGPHAVRVWFPCRSLS